MDISTVTRKLISDEIIKEEKDKDGNIVTTIKRKEQLIDPTSETNEKRFIISEIKRTKIIKIGTFGIKQRAELPKFGLCENQSRGTVENGIIRLDNEVKITNRKKAVYQEGLKDRLKSSNAAINKEELEKKMFEEMERKKMQISEKPKFEENKRTYREAKDTDIKITGFNMRCDEKDLILLFENVGEVHKCRILRDKITKKKRNIAFLEFKNSIDVEEAIKRYDNKSVGGCVLMVCRPGDDY